MIRVPIVEKLSPDILIIDSSTVRMTEARLNDAVYMLFSAAMGMPPRECDIRVMMDVVVPERIKSVAQAILSPTETAGASHTTKYDVNLERLIEESLTYMEDHWLKGTHPHRQQILNYYEDGVLVWIMGADESECAKVTDVDPAFDQPRTPDNPLGET